MNKIGILTFHRSTNNGALIQCYSLAKRLQADFPDSRVEVVDYSMPRVHNRIYADTLSEYFSECSFREGVSRFKNLLIDPFKLSYQRNKNEVFSKAIKELPLSNEYIYENSFDHLFSYIESNYDQIVVGSDAVWNYSLRGFPNPYFLKEKMNVKKLTYAASCYGLNYEHLPDVEMEQIGIILNSYDFIGVRDDESCSFAKTVGCNKDIHHTCDPTVFLDVESLPVDVDELTLKMVKNGYDITRKSVGIMGSNELCKMVRRILGNEYQIVSLFNFCKDADVNLYNITPFEWAYVFRYFQITFTTYFHGTLLSLRNGVPVICVELVNDYSKTHTTKVEDFLSRIGLQDYYFRTDYSGNDDLEIKKSACFAIQNLSRERIITSMKEESYSYRIFKDALMSML